MNWTFMLYLIHYKKIKKRLRNWTSHVVPVYFFAQIANKILHMFICVFVQIKGSICVV